MAAQTQYLTLGVAGDLYAAPVDRVREILDPRPAARIPRAPRGMIGLIDVRGDSVPLMDLRALLDAPSREDDAATRLIVLELTDADRRRVAVKSDRVFEVAALDDDALEPPPGGDGQGVVLGVGRRNGAFVAVLDFDRLLPAFGAGPT